ncbi:MAG: RluA family pseudouridine synthase [Rhodobacteraceae bacterium]|nr:RluA family pseudouridine synthase [Paracoccaceae bacterium]
MSDPIDRLLVLTLSDAPPARLDKALAQVVPEGVSLSRSRLAKLVEEGAVARAGTGEVVSVLKTKGLPGEEWLVTLPEPQALEAVAQDIPLDVVFEDEHLIVVNKPAGMVVHPAPGSKDGTLVNALLHHCGDTLAGIGGEKRPGIVHRIDKNTSGLLVVAKTDAAHQGLAKQFADHSIERRYVAFTHGSPSAADPRLRGLMGVGYEDGGVLRIATNIARHKTDRKKMAVVTNSGRHAITRARVARAYGPAGRPVAARLECWLETGRTHQIRVHMAHCGHGLLGDPVYGGKKRLSRTGLSETDVTSIEAFQRQALHAARLGFIHPATNERQIFETDLPNDLIKLQAVLERF